MQRILSSPSVPTAVFTAADILAIGAMRAIREAGLRVPEDMAVVGVDDIDSAAFQCPPLTTVRQSIEELSELSVRLLLDLLSGEKAMHRQIVMEPEMVIRESTSAPRDMPVDPREASINAD